MIANQLTIVIAHYFQTFFLNMYSFLENTYFIFLSFYPNFLFLPPSWHAAREEREANKTATMSSFDWLLLWISAGYSFMMNCKFILLEIKSEINALDLGSIWESWHFIHHIKPTKGGYLEVKGFQDPSMYSREKYHITIQWNLWTHCSIQVTLNMQLL